MQRPGTLECHHEDVGQLTVHLDRVPLPFEIVPDAAPAARALIRPGSSAQVGRDPRVAAAIAVLAGEDVQSVAARFAMPAALVARYAEIFEAAGADAVTGLPAADEQRIHRSLGMLAHEMRAPLTAVRSWVELLGTDMLDDDEQEPARQLIFARVDRIRRLCDDLLDATAMQLGRLRLCRTQVDFAALVRDVARSLADDRIVVDCAGPAQLVGDPDRLDQVVTNLLTNALRHGGPGTVDVRVRQAGGAGGIVEMAVRNAGPLRGPVEASHIFDAFETGCDAGHGLGLFVVRQIVQAHGGDIDVRGGDETEFFLWLPCGGPPPGALDVPSLS